MKLSIAVIALALAAIWVGSIQLARQVPAPSEFGAGPPPQSQSDSQAPAQPSPSPEPDPALAEAPFPARPSVPLPWRYGPDPAPVVPSHEVFTAFDKWLEDRSARASAAADSSTLDAEGLRLALRRREEMEELIRSNPKEALARALAPSVRATLPARIAEVVEQYVSGRGDLEVVCAYPEPGREGEVIPLRRYVALEGNRFTAFVYGRRLSQPTQLQVSLQGITLGRLMAVDEGPDDLPPAGSTFPLAPSPATEGLKRLLFIRVDFSDLPGELLTTNRAAELTRELHRFYQESSYGRSGFLEIGAGSAVTPVFRMPRTATSYGSNDDAGDLRSDALTAAANAGYILDNYDYDITCLRSVAGFDWSGLGMIGAPGAWIRGTSSLGVTAHELGHNYGLRHANFWDTGGTSITGAGTSIEYGDKFDTMGAASAGNNHFNARYKRLLGWLKEGEYTVATTNGTYRIYAHDQTNAVTGSRGLQIFANARTNYWVEFRQKFTGNRWLVNGVGVRWTGRGGEASLLLDTTPGSPREKDDASITLGRTFSDPISGIHITPLQKGGSNPAWIDVAVQRGAFSGNRPPQIHLTASASTGTTATTVSFQAAASDPDGDAIAYHWDFADESLGANSPNESHRWASAGDYVVQCTASDRKGGVARASLLIRIGTPTTLRISGRVTADGEPVEGVRVAVAPDRYTFTDSLGQYTLTGLNPGAYTVSATRERVGFEPVSFTNPITVPSNRSNLDFATVDVIQRRTVTLLPAGSSWRYWDQGTAPATSWIRRDFSDSDWSAGPAILGYGGDRETTVIDFGPDPNRKHITTWFRRTFVIDDPSRLANVRIGLLRDDGAAIYLNGTELLRDELPNGTLSATTLASSTASGNEELTYYPHDVPVSRLVRGTNLFAVEIHQISASSSDIAFDLRLTADALETVEPGIRLVRPIPGESFRTSDRVVLSAAIGDLPGAAFHHVAFLADGRQIGSATNPPFSITWIHPPAGDHVLVASAILNDGSQISSPAITNSVIDADLSPTLIPRGAVWRYLDTGIAPGADWHSLRFDDATWPSGLARLGYGEDGEMTVVRFGTNPALRHITTWFRHTFDLLGVSSITQLACRLARDDGAVVYLNGSELFRSGIRTGIVTPTQLAQSEVRDESEVLFTERIVPVSNLVEGLNVIAVEVHQASQASTDVGFDLELVAQRNALPEVPRLSLLVQNGQLRLSWPAPFANWRLESSPRLGPDATWHPVGTVSSTTSSSTSETTRLIPLSDATEFFRLTRP